MCESVDEDLGPVVEVVESEEWSVIALECSLVSSVFCDFYDLLDVSTETKLGEGGEELVSPVGDSPCTHVRPVE